MFFAIAILLRLIIFFSTIPPETSEKLHTDVQVEKPPLSANAKKGEALFRVNCASCHGMRKNLTGPALAGVEGRWPSKKLLYMWIRNWPAAVATGDPFARMMRDWSPVAMNSFPLIKDDEIEAIVSFVKESATRN